jgi:hypothetical protein
VVSKSASLPLSRTEAQALLLASQSKRKSNWAIRRGEVLVRATFLFVFISALRMEPIDALLHVRQALYH